MPLSAPVERELEHTRVIHCHGYSRADGLWDIEAQMVDTKPFSFPNQDRGGTIQADEALHDMKVRLTIDKNLLIHAAEAVTDASPFNYCVKINAAYQQLVGLSIGPGWNQRIKSLFGRNQGCTHISELMGTMATVSIQTLFGSKATRDLDSTLGKPRPLNPVLLNSCHAFDEKGELVQERWPVLFSG